jgi:hypothetical protein
LIALIGLAIGVYAMPGIHFTLINSLGARGAYIAGAVTEQQMKIIK